MPARPCVATDDLHIRCQLLAMAVALQVNEDATLRVESYAAGVPLASQRLMKRTLFSIALITIGMTAIGGFESGDGVPAPPPEQLRKFRPENARSRQTTCPPAACGDDRFESGLQFW